MLMRTFRGSIYFVLFMGLLITACATTTLTSVWKDPLYRGQPRKILVIGIARKPINKRIFEDEFVRRLKVHGIQAVAGYTVMPDDKQGDNAVIDACLKEQGADAVLISRLASKKTVHVYVPGSVTSTYGTWRVYYGYGFHGTQEPGYTAEDEYALMEMNLYDATSDKLIWSAASETEIQGSNQNQIRSYIGVMVQAMADQKLLRR